jgi:flavin-dependent dehydrogenase
MERCDVLIVGGGPAGSACAWGLRDFGLDVVIADARGFPRDKVCAGWITPAVLRTLAIDQTDYRTTGVLQPIRGFRLSVMGEPTVITEYPEIVSYAIRRCEFDQYLLRRSGARLALGEPIHDIRRTPCGWIVDDRFEARVLVGAGGHFCPVARRLSGERGNRVVVAQETEIDLERAAIDDHEPRPDLPTLMFDRDLRGYGWALRKDSWMNIGYGRESTPGRGVDLSGRIEALTDLLRRTGQLPDDLGLHFRGHAYLTRSWTRAPVAVPGALLVGDAAGLARASSGEGIRAAIESGLLAAETIAARPMLRPERYTAALEARFGRCARARRGPTELVPARWRAGLAARLLTVPAFARHIVVDHWFLHTAQAPLDELRI